MLKKIKKFIGLASKTLSSQKSDNKPIPPRQAPAYASHDDLLKDIATLRQKGNLPAALDICARGLERWHNSMKLWRARGDIQMEKRDFFAALETWREFVSRFPTKGYGYNRAARAAMELGDFDFAEKMFNEGTVNAPRDKLAWYIKGDVAMRKKNFPEALEAWNAVREKFPEHDLAYVQSVFCLRETGRVEEALALEEEYISKYNPCGETLAKFAENALHQRELPSALKRWREVIDKSPDKPEGYLGAARTAAETGDLEQEKKFILKGLEKAPHSRDLLIAYANIPMRQRDFSEALKRWENVIAEFPDHGYAYNRAAWAAIELGNLEYAEEKYREGTTNAPDFPDPWFLGGDLAMRRKDFPGAIRAWAEIREKFPEHWLGYLQGAYCLRQMGKNEDALALEEGYITKYNPGGDVLAKFAGNALAQGDLPLALKRWREVIDKSPDKPEGYLGAAKTCAKTGDYKQEEAYILAGLRAAPQDVDLHIAYAQIPERKRDFSEALKRWENVIAKFPGNGLAYNRAAWAAIGLGDLAYAEEKYREGTVSAPDFPDPWFLGGDLAMRRGDFSAAVEAWAEIRNKFPEHWLPYLQGAFCLRQTGQNGEAEALEEEYITKYLPDGDVLAKFAGNALAQGDLPLALKRWREVIAKSPDKAAGYLGAAKTCAKTGDYKQEEAYILAGLRAAPQDVDLHIAYAQIPERKRDFSEALKRWENVIAKFPGNGLAYNRAAWAAIGLGDLAYAEEKYREGTAGAPDFPEPWFLGGDLAMRRGDFSAAVEAWAEIRNKFPEHWLPYLQGAFCLRQTGHNGDAEALEEEFIAKYKPEGDVLAKFAGNALAQGDLPLALKRWREVIEKSPDKAKGYLGAAKTCAKTGDYKQEEAYILAGLRAAPRAVDLHVAYAQIPERQRDYAKARKRWENVIAKFPNHGLAYNRAAWAAIGLGDLAYAEEKYREGTASAPDFPEPWFLGGDLAMRRGDFSAAVEAWAEVRKKFPEHWLPYLQGAFCLRQTGQNGDAEALEEEYITKYLPDGDVLAKFAGNALAQGDLPLALKRWREVIEKSPDKAKGYLGAAKTCAKLKDFGQEESFILTGLQAAPRAVDLHVAYAQIPERQRDYAEARKRWESVIAKFPNHGLAYNRAAWAAIELGDLAYAEEKYREGTANAPDFPDPWFLRGDLAMRRRDFSGAVEAWAEVRNKFPEHWLGYLQGAFCLRKIGQNQEALNLEEEFLTKNNPDGDVLAKFAENDLRRRDFPLALKRWREVIEKNHEKASGYLGAAKTRAESDDFEQEEAFILAGLEKAPQAIDLHIAYARIPERQRDYAEALKRWEHVITKFPRHGLAYNRAAWAAIELGDLRYAEHKYKEGVANAPDFPDPWFLPGDIAMRRMDMPKAITAWAEVREKFPEHWLAYVQGSFCLRENGQPKEAEHLEEDYISNFNPDGDVLAKFAENALRQGDFTLALKRWREVMEKCPDKASGYVGAAKTRVAAGDYEQAENLLLKGMETEPEAIDAHIAYAQISMRRRDFTEARKRWESVIAKFPGHGDAYNRAAWTAMELGDLEYAEKMYREGTANAPRAMEPWFLAADIAMRRRDFPAALRNWREVIVRFPKHGQGYNGAAYACMDMGDYAQAETIAAAGIKNAPFYNAAYLAHADAAMRQRRFDAALKRCATLREKFPATEEGYTIAAEASVEKGDFEQAERFCREAAENIPTASAPYVTYADIAARRRDIPEALRRWGKVIEKFPALGKGYGDAAYACMESGDYGQAETFAVEGMKNAPYFIDGYLAYAEIAMRRRDFAEALRRWQMVIEKFPTLGRGYGGAAYACMESGDNERAETFAAEGMKNAPYSIDGYFAYADIAMRRRNFETALERAAILREKFPFADAGYNTAARASVELHDFQRAEQFCQEAAEKIPTAFAPYVTLAEIAMRRRDFAEALRRWQMVIEKFPTLGRGYGGAAYACMESGDNERAETFAAEGMKNAPYSIDGYFAYADIAMRRRNFKTALERAAILREKFPFADAGYNTAAWASVELHDFQRAEQFCREAAENMPTASASYVTYADIAARRRDFPEALRRWQKLIEKFPTLGRGYGGAAYACMETGDYDRAETFAAEGMKNAPYSIDGYFAYADIAMRRRNFKTALERAAILREKFPFADAGYNTAAWASVELHDFKRAEQFCREALKKIPEAFAPRATYAEIAMRRRDFAEALTRWRELIVKFPNHGGGYNGAAIACLEQGNFDQAEIISLTGIKSAPRFIDPYLAYAEISMRKRDYPTAAERWALVREKFPHHGVAYGRGAFVAIELSDYQEAETLCELGMKNAPEFMEPMSAYADYPVRRDFHGFKGALERWRMVRDKFPRHGLPYGALAKICRDIGDFEQAEAWALKAMEMAPQFMDGWFWHAEIAMAKREYKEALERWAIGLRKFPHIGSFYARAAYSRLELEDYEEAEKVCALGFEKAPDSAEPLIMSAEIAMRKRDYKLANERWQKLREWFPAIREGYSRGGLTRMLTGDFAGAKRFIDSALRIAPFDIMARRCLTYLNKWEKSNNEERETLKVRDEKFIARAENLIKKYNLGQDNRIGLIWFGKNIGDCYYFASALTYVQKSLKKRFVVITEESASLNKFIDAQNANGADIEKVCVDKATKLDLIYSSCFIREKFSHVLDFFKLTYEYRFLFNRGKRLDIFNNLTSLSHSSRDVTNYAALLGIIPGKTVFINPNANAFGKTPPYFWKITIFSLKLLGYKIVINSKGKEKPYGDDVIYFSPPFNEIVDFANLCGIVMGARSGLLEMIAAEGKAKVIVLHPEDPIGNITEIYPFIDNSDNHIIESPLNKRWIDDPLFADIKSLIYNTAASHNKSINLMAEILEDKSVPYKTPELKSGIHWAKITMPAYFIPAEASTFDFCKVQYKFYKKANALYLYMRIEPDLSYEIHLTLMNRHNEDFKEEYLYYNNKKIVFDVGEPGEYFVKVLIIHPVSKASCTFETESIIIR